jgi:GT2 family glycosyltransferase
MKTPHDEIPPMNSYVPDKCCLSIIVVSHNTRDLLEDCLSSIQQTVGELDCEILVIDNRSEDGSVEMVKNKFPEVRLTANGQNQGYARACNQGMRAAQGQYLLLLNSDILVLDGTLEGMLKIMEVSPRMGELGCRLLNTDRSLQQSVGLDVGWMSEFIQKFFLNRWEKSRNPLAGKVLRRMHTVQRKVDWLKGACVLLRREAIFEAELMDPVYFMYLEDADLSRRLRQLGWDVVFTPQVEVIHHEGASARKNNAQVALEYRRSQLRYYRKFYGEGSYRCLRMYLKWKMAKDRCFWKIKRCLRWGTPEGMEEQDRLLTSLERWLQGNEK